MTVFEQRTFGIGSDRSANWATTTARVKCWFDEESQSTNGQRYRFKQFFCLVGTGMSLLFFVWMSSSDKQDASGYN